MKIVLIFQIYTSGGTTKNTHIGTICKIPMGNWFKTLNNLLTQINA